MLGLMMLPGRGWCSRSRPSVTVAKLARARHRRGDRDVQRREGHHRRVGGLPSVAASASGHAVPRRRSAHIPALLVVAAAIIATDEALAIPVLALMTDQRVRDVFRRDWQSASAARLVRLLVAIVAGYLLRFDQRMAIATPLLLVGLHLAYANHVQQRADQLAWQRLARIADALGGSHEYAVRRAAMLGAAELFSCDEVDLEINTMNGDASLMRGTPSAITYVGAARQGTAITVAWSSRRALESHGVWHPKPGELRLRFFAPVDLHRT